MIRASQYGSHYRLTMAFTSQQWGPICLMPSCQPPLPLAVWLACVLLYIAFCLRACPAGLLADLKMPERKTRLQAVLNASCYVKHVHDKTVRLSCVPNTKKVAPSTPAAAYLYTVKHVYHLSCLLGSCKCDNAVGVQLSDKVLQDQVIGQLFAGHETTAAIMTHLLQRVKASPQVLACMRREQASLIEQHGPQLTGEGQRPDCLHVLCHAQLCLAC